MGSLKHEPSELRFGVMRGVGRGIGGDTAYCQTTIGNLVSVIAVVNSRVPRCVRMSRDLHQWDDFAESHHIPHGTQSADPDVRRRRLGQRAQRHAVRLRRLAWWCTSTLSAERVPDAAGLVRERVWRRQFSAGACYYLLLHRTQNCGHCRWLTWRRLLWLIQYSVVMETVTWWSFQSVCTTTSWSLVWPIRSLLISCEWWWPVFLLSERGFVCFLWLEKTM